MVRSRLALAALGVSAALVGAAEAQDPAFPDLVGSWVGEKTVYFFDGTRHSVEELQITRQDGSHFSGTRSWHHPEADKDPLGHVGGEQIHRASEPILGIVDFDGETLHIVEHDDWAHIRARLVDADTMEVVYIESGPNAAVYRVTLKRER